MNSTTGNGSIESSSCFSATAYKIGRTIALSLIIAVSLTANSFIVLIVYKTPTLRKPINYFIANMAMSDLLFSIFWLPTSLSLLHTNQSWLIGGQFGQALCKLVPFFTDVSNTVSIQSLVLITVDRFVAVVFPFRSPLIRSKLCPFFILGTWIAGVAVISPQFFTFRLVENSGGKMFCVVRWEEAFGESLSFTDYQLAGSILFRFVPVMLLAILYSIMLFKLKAREHPGEQSANTQQQRNRRNRNVFQMSTAIVLAFLVCWLPLETNILVIWNSSSMDFSCGFWLYYYVTYYMSFGYFTINPIICFVFSSNYRQGLKKLVNCS